MNKSKRCTECNKFALRIGLKHLCKDHYYKALEEKRQEEKVK